MKKKILIGFCLTFIIVGIIINVSYDKKEINKDKSKLSSGNNGLSMMFETDVASGEYKLTNQSRWLGDDYIFNDVLSSCENGSTLIWNEEKKTISKKGSIPDRCMIYFDKYVLPSITSYEITNTEDSISIILTSAPGTSEIEGYYYSIDDGETYVDNTSTTYTFSDLQKGIYKVKIYIKDTIGRKSIILEKQVYVLAKPTSPTLAFDSSYNVLISGSTSENGDVEYYYSLDNTNFTKGNIVTVSKSSTIYAYGLDEMNQKSDVVSKAITVSSAVNGTVTNSYYCSKTSSYQSGFTCSYSYIANSDFTYSCSSGSQKGAYCYFYSTTTLHYDSSYSLNCDLICAGKSSYAEGSCSSYNTLTQNFTCTYASSRTDATVIYTYSCPNGGSLSGIWCENATYMGTSKYKCLNTYYDTKAAATAACTNYCATGTYHNGKCYKLS